MEFFPSVWFLKHPTVYKNRKALCFRVLHGSKPWVKHYSSFVYMFTTVSEISPIFCVRVHSCEWNITYLLCTCSQLAQLWVKYHPPFVDTFTTYLAVSEVSLIFHVHIHSLLTYLSYTCSQLKQFQYHLYETSWLCWNLVGVSSLVFLQITKSHKTNRTLPYVTHRWKEKKRKNKTNKNDCPPPQNHIFVAVKLTSLNFSYTYLKVLSVN